MKKLIILLMLLAFLFAFIYGDNQSLDNFKEVILNLSSFGKTIQLPPDSMAVIKLPCVPSTGYRWEVINYSQWKDIIRELHGSPYGDKCSEFAKPTQGEKIRPGSSQTQIIRLVGEKEGMTQIRLILRRPWEVRHSRYYHINIHSLGKFTGHFTPHPVLNNSDPETPEEIYAPGLPAHFDWREQNGVTPVKDQLNCGSCWAFATVAAFEAKILIKDGVERDLSEQYLISCNTDNSNCDGGRVLHDYHWLKSIPGVSDAGSRYESDYPFQMADSICQDQPAHEQLEGWAYCDDVAGVGTHNATTVQLKQKIYDYGPVTTTVCVSNWSGYTGGVHTTHCDSPNHTVLITGWDDNEDCFYIKNSWGSNWGEEGYIRMAYNTCLIGEDSTYVLYEKTNPRIVPKSLTFREDKTNDGSIGLPIELNIEDSNSSTQFSRSSSNFIQGCEFTVSNLPSGLSINIQALNTTRAKIYLNGIANNHSKINNISNLSISFLDAAFSGNSASAVEGSTNNSYEIKFIDPYQIIYFSDPSANYVNASNPLYFYEVGGYDADYRIVLHWYESPTEPDPYNTKCLKMETQSLYTIEWVLTNTNANPSNIKSLPYGTEIGPNSTIWTPNKRLGKSHTIAGPAYHDLKGGTHYVGFSFTNNGDPVYGWMQLEVNPDGTQCRLIDYAWQQDPNKTILAGQTTDIGIPL